MNFLCDRCKQKYHVADEKVRGRAVTRFKCKKCEHVIELRLGDLDGGAPDDATHLISGTGSIPPPAPPSVRPPTQSVPVAGVRSPTATRPAATYVPPAAPRPATSTSAPPPDAPGDGARALDRSGERDRAAPGDEHGASCDQCATDDCVGPPGGKTSGGAATEYEQRAAHQRRVETVGRPGRNVTVA